MFNKKAIITIDVSTEKAFNYLKTRYDSLAFQEASKMTKGYVPNVKVCDIEENKSIEYSVSGRDPILGIPISSWRWGYILTALSPQQTKIEIWYRYSIWLALLGAGTIGHQAANEISEAALALDALSK